MQDSKSGPWLLIIIHVQMMSAWYWRGDDDRLLVDILPVISKNVDPKV
jgi:hypothetical protein